MCKWWCLQLFHDLFIKIMQCWSTWKITARSLNIHHNCHSVFLLQNILYILDVQVGTAKVDYSISQKRQLCLALVYRRHWIHFVYCDQSEASWTNLSATTRPSWICRWCRECYLKQNASLWSGPEQRLRLCPTQPMLGPCWVINVFIHQLFHHSM